MPRHVRTWPSSVADIFPSPFLSKYRNVSVSSLVRSKEAWRPLLLLGDCRCDDLKPQSDPDFSFRSFGRLFLFLSFSILFFSWGVILSRNDRGGLEVSEENDEDTEQLESDEDWEDKCTSFPSFDLLFGKNGMVIFIFAGLTRPTKQSSGRRFDVTEN